jgi:hypothetical protein
MNTTKKRRKLLTIKRTRDEPTRIKRENRRPLKQEVNRAVKIEESPTVKKEEPVFVQHEPMITRVRKRAKAESAPTKPMVGDNQDAHDRNLQKWQVVPANAGRFVLSPISMSWVKIGTGTYQTLLSDSITRGYLEYTPVVKMDGRRWSTYAPSSSQAVRRHLPKEIFLIPELRKYPVATKEGEEPWSSGLRAAMARARLPSSRNPAVFAKALELMYMHYEDDDQSLPGVKHREPSNSRKFHAISRLLSERLASYPRSRPEDMPPLEKFV